MRHELTLPEDYEHHYPLRIRHVYPAKRHQLHDPHIHRCDARDAKEVAVELL